MKTRLFVGTWPIFALAIELVSDRSSESEQWSIDWFQCSGHSESQDSFHGKYQLYNPLFKRSYLSSYLFSRIIAVQFHREQSKFSIFSLTELNSFKIFFQPQQRIHSIKRSFSPRTGVWAYSFSCMSVCSSRTWSPGQPIADGAIDLVNLRNAWTFRC
jgi:hypothetical protein